MIECIIHGDILCVDVNAVFRQYITCHLSVIFARVNFNAVIKTRQLATLVDNTFTALIHARAVVTKEAFGIRYHRFADSMAFTRLTAVVTGFGGQ